MDICDPHIHMISRVTDDYEKMALAGYRVVVEPSFWVGEPRTSVGTFKDYFNHILRFEAERARQHGIAHYSCIALNPREANDRALAKDVLAVLETFVTHERCVAVGEIGFDDITDPEVEAAHMQLALAKKHGLPVMVHTPHRNKKAGVARIIAMSKEHGIPPERLLVDHNTEETIGLCREHGCWAGHTVYPVTKLSPERAVNIMDEHGIERLMVNSSADWGVSDALSVARVAAEMRKRGYTSEQVRRVVWENPIAFYQQSGRAFPELVTSK
jgi:predicted metal-dependent TIM-barrel fold hydrolase